MRHLTFISLIAALSLCATAQLLAAPAPDPASDHTQAAVEQAVSRVLPSLVRVHVVEVDHRFGREVKSEATGSGVIFTPDGHVITNHHVAGNAKQLVCKLASKEEIDAEVVGSDPLTDICVIKLLPKQDRRFTPASFGDSSALQPGDTVLAMGSPLALSQSVTLGIVSNTALVMPELFWPFKFEMEGEDIGSIVRWIGHDAELNPGNSGGPLVDLLGRVVGINEMQFGLGAAIPGNLARAVADQLVANGKVARAWLGLEVQPLLRSQPDLAGVLVSSAIPGSPAEAAGLEPGDILTSLGGSPVSVRFPEELPLFNQLVADLPIGRTVRAVVLRDGAPLTLDIRTEDRDTARPKERELSEWGMTARDLALIEAKELGRDTRNGVLLTSLRSGGPCDDAKPKLVERDIIIAVDGKTIANVRDLDEATRSLTADADDLVPTVVTFDRGVERYLTVAKIGRKPLPQPAQEVRKAWLGLSTQVLTRELAEALDLKGVTGVRITQVLPGTSADQAGLRVGDLIVALDGEEIPASRPQHQDLFPAMVRRYDIGASAELTVIRDGTRKVVPVLFQESPPTAREMKTYRDDVFDFAVRDVSVADRASRKWQRDRSGVLVAAVSEGGWAALAHLAVGDMIVAVDREPTPDAAALESLMKRAATDKRTSVVLHAFRGIHAIYIELLPKWADARP